jgi:glycosyltransferase involved in cell wall biosynthesis
MHGFDTVGGVEQHTRGIIEALRDDVAFNVVVQNGAPGAWCDFVEERRHPHLRVAALNQGLRALGVQVLEFPANVRDESVERAFEAFLAGGYDVVHFHSPVGWNTMRLPGLARRSGARVVVGVHDMGWMCADYNMVIGVQERPCGRVAARGADEGCVQCIRGKSVVVGAAAEDDVPDFIDERLAAAARAMADADVVVCPSRFAAGRVEAAFSAGHAREIRIIGHGVQELPRIYRAADRPLLTVAVLGRFSPRKGALELLEAAGRLQGERIVFESWGPIDGRVREQAIRLGVRLNGPYGVADLARHLRGVDLVMVPTRLEETFCLTLAEAQALGIPVAAARIGAIPERIRDGENGFLFEPGNVDAMVALLVRLRDDRSLLAGVAARLAAERPKTIEENAAEYLALYRELAARHGEPAPVARRAPPDIRIHASSPRRRTPLGSEDYDRWLDAQSPVRASRGGSITLKVIELAEADDAEGARALNRAIAQCEAEWVVLAEAGDRIAEGALEEVSAAIAGEPRAAFVFGDHDAMSSRGERYDPVFKPRFDAELLRHAPYVAGLCALRRERCLAMGGLEVGGWLGVVEFALRLASLEDPALLASVRGIVVHRLDANLAKLERPEFRRRMGEIVDKARGPAGARAVRLAATPGTPAMWSYGQAETAGVSVFLQDARSKRDAELCLDALLRAGSRIAELFVDLPEEAAAQLRGTAGGGYAAGRRPSRRGPPGGHERMDRGRGCAAPRVHARLGGAPAAGHPGRFRGRHRAAARDGVGFAPQRGDGDGWRPLVRRGADAGGRGPAARSMRCIRIRARSRVCRRTCRSGAGARCDREVRFPASRAPGASASHIFRSRCVNAGSACSSGRSPPRASTNPSRPRGSPPLKRRFPRTWRGCASGLERASRTIPVSTPRSPVLRPRSRSCRASRRRARACCASAPFPTTIGAPARCACASRARRWSGRASRRSR